MLSFTEENYLKVLFKLTQENANEKAGTNELAINLGVKCATANDMLKRLKEKKLIDYEKYGKITLTNTGKKNAIKVVRKHRLWETFLYEKMDFSWDEVHEVAEQMEHIQSEKLLEQLDKFLGYPKFDPHGDPIPDTNGKMSALKAMLLSEGVINKKYKLVGVCNHSSAFLQFLDKTGLTINNNIEVKEIQEFDKSMSVIINNKSQTIISNEVTQNLLVM
jgi:DtxR family transcriptional regulator, Mn-dependent transcriptional regulator